MSRKATGRTASAVIKLVAAWGLWWAALGVVAGPGRAEERPAGTPALRVMTFNIRCLTLEDGRDGWWFRRDHVAELIRREAPDLAGLQEAYTTQARDLERRLPGYAWYGPPRDDGKRRGERTPIFYRTDRLALLASGQFWLSATPETPSRSWDSACTRIVVWGKFRDRRSGAEFFFFNTHFDHKGQVARERSAALLIERIRAIAGDGPVIVTGDFNATEDTVPYRTITARLRDARAFCATPPRGCAATTRGFPLDSQPEKRIDYVFVSPGIGVSGYAVLEDTHDNGRRPSDHMPVMVELETEK